jgi:hypothetical protein
MRDGMGKRAEAGEKPEHMRERRRKEERKRGQGSEVENLS